MTMTELKQIAASCQSNAEFVRNPKVREVYCKCLGTEGPWLHLAYSDRYLPALCSKCGQEYDWPQSRPTCPVPDPIPGSLPDAVEMLRKKVAEKWEASYKWRSLLASVCDKVAGCRTWEQEIIFATPIDRFMVFAAALGGVAVEEK